MIEILILSAIITARLHARDRMYHKQGLPPPSSKLVDAWLARHNSKRANEGKKPVKPAKYGMWRYFWQRWQAMWELQSIQAGQRHQQKVADRKAGKAPEPKTPLKERLAASWQWVLDNIVAPRGETKTTETEPAAPKTGPEQAAPAEGPRIACQDCGQTLRHVDGEWQHPSSAGCPAKHDPEPRPDPGEMTETNPVAAPAVAKPATQEEPSMAQPTTTQLSGEVTGTRSAVAYARAVADAHARHSGNEGYLTSLARMEVGDGDINLVRHAMQQSQLAGAAWTAAADSIDRNNAALREAYANAPDAASKAANINE